MNGTLLGFELSTAIRPPVILELRYRTDIRHAARYRRMMEAARAEPARLWRFLLGEQKLLGRVVGIEITTHPELCCVVTLRGTPGWRRR